jgi:hypothetical protein
MLALAMLIALGACGDAPGAGTGETGGRAEGEVLGGAISDDMIALEQLTSEAPLAPREGPSAAAVDAGQPQVAGEQAPADPPTEAAPAPAPAPAPAANQ